MGVSDGRLYKKEEVRETWETGGKAPLRVRKLAPRDTFRFLKTKKEVILKARERKRRGMTAFPKYLTPSYSVAFPTRYHLETT